MIALARSSARRYSFGILNAFLRPILLLLMAPLIILTLGIFIFVVNALHAPLGE